MSGIGTKPRFGGTRKKSRFGGGTAIKYGEGFNQNQAKEKGQMTGLEYVYLVPNQPNAKMLTQFSKTTDAVATYVGKKSEKRLARWPPKPSTQDKSSSETNRTNPQVTQRHRSPLK